MTDTLTQQIRKSIQLSRLDALKSILYLRFGITSPSETSLINELLLLSNGLPMTLEPNIRADVERTTKISGISTALGRIERTGALSRAGKTIVFNPILNKWNETGQILFKINP